MTEPVILTVKRYQCPHCSRARSSRKSALEHMGRCWLNPAVRGCKTCRHFEPAYWETAEGCELGVDLTARCRACEGVEGSFFGEPCSVCGGSRLDPNMGTRPITDCGQWEASV